MRRHPQSIAGRRAQQGAALILIMFMLGMGLIAFMLKTVGTSTLEFQQKDRTTLALEEAKTALIAWSASHPNWPGIMPFPDRKETSSPPNYDGKSDCVTTGLNTTHLIGMLPVLGDSPCISPQIGLGLQSFGAVKLCESGATSCDETGTRLWYAVSKNLIRTSSTASDPVINPSIIDSKTWMRVVDRNGNLISDRVAAVIIAPGPPLPNQDRSGVPDATEYLDSLQIGATVYSNQDDDSDDEDFIMAPDSAHHPASDATYQSPYYFNDRLVYITIDELMAAVEKRVAAEVKAALVNYKSNYGVYPYAAPLGVSLNYSCKDGVTAGFLPLDTLIGLSSNVTCNSNTKCGGISFVNDFSSVSHDLEFMLPWSGSSGACKNTDQTCTCNGAGSCTLYGLINYTCSTSTGISQCQLEQCVFGPCTPRASTKPTIFKPKYTDSLKSTGSVSVCGPTVTVTSPGSIESPTCGDLALAPKFSVTINGNSITGSGFVSPLIREGMYITDISGQNIDANTKVDEFTNTEITTSKIALASGPATIRISFLNSWFFKNGWQDYVYYAMSKAPASLTVGSRTNVNALLVTTGKAIASTPYTQSKASPQSRSLSCSNADYLDSTENANADNVYDVTSKARKENYNDQMFIVSP